WPEATRKTEDQNVCGRGRSAPPTHVPGGMSWTVHPHTPLVYLYAKPSLNCGSPSAGDSTDVRNPLHAHSDAQVVPEEHRPPGGPRPVSSRPIPARTTEGKTTCSPKPPQPPRTARTPSPTTPRKRLGPAPGCPDSPPRPRWLRH